MTREEILQAVARGYCTKENDKKVLDLELCYAIANEVFKIIEKESQEGDSTISAQNE